MGRSTPSALWVSECHELGLGGKSVDAVRAKALARQSRSTCGWRWSGVPVPRSRLREGPHGGHVVAGASASQARGLRVRASGERDHAVGVAAAPDRRRAPHTSISTSPESVEDWAWSGGGSTGQL